MDNITEIVTALITHHLTGCRLVSTSPGRLTVRSARTGRERTYRCYRDGHWEMVHR